MELVLLQYHAYLDVFEKKALECMPLHKPWDHAIDLVLDFKLIKFHIYPFFFFFSLNNLYTAISTYMCGLASMY